VAVVALETYNIPVVMVVVVVEGIQTQRALRVQEQQTKVTLEDLLKKAQKPLVAVVALVRLGPRVLVLVRRVTAALEWHLLLAVRQLFMLVVVAVVAILLFLALLMEQVETAVAVVAQAALVVLEVRELLILEVAVVAVLKRKTVALVVQA
jgi:hypothetical protein